MICTGCSRHGMPSKSDEIRRLLNEGRSRSEVARIVGCAYQQVFQVDKKRHGAPTSYQSPPSIGRARPSHNLSAPGSFGTPRGPQLRFGPGPRQDPSNQSKERKPIRTGPSQVRVAVQDGHEVRLYEGVGGTECWTCKESIQYSLRDLAYVHTSSGSPVTRLINLQQGPGFFDDD